MTINALYRWEPYMVDLNLARFELPSPSLFVFANYVVELISK
jgi:hypothetical protein